MNDDDRRSGWSLARAPLGGLAIALALGLSGNATPFAQDDVDPELEALLAEERDMAEQDRRHGEIRRALRAFEEHLREDSADIRSLLGRARCRRDLGELDAAQADFERALELARDVEGERGRALRAASVRALGDIHLERGEVEEATRVFSDAEGDVDPRRDARDAWLAGRIAWLSGDLAGARAAWGEGAGTQVQTDWTQLLAKALCERRLGDLERASRSLIAADRAAGQPEPDVLVELASVYFEADGEVAHKEAAGRSPGEILREAERIHPTHEGVLLGLFALHDLNWRRQSRTPQELLDMLFAVRPDSIEGLLTATRSDLEDGQLVKARERLARLAELAPQRRETRTLTAVLAWIEHRREEAEATLAELSTELAYDSTPERTLARTLCELYRFAEALPFAERAVERDPSDHRAWTQLARARANTGDENGAREAFERAEVEARGRHDVWRHNLQLVLRKLQDYTEEQGSGQLEYVWSKDASAVLAIYWKPFYAEAREELSRRYGFTPDDVRIEIFRQHRDFSVRSTGYEQFPALGVCFGPVVTSLSPLSELRGTFSWARTAFHEFTHVIHLGLSHNRCPRWITEGLATWEEAQRNPVWARNMRRELVDAVANDDLIPVRELNRAFRGPRILFGYYQGGLLCEMLIAHHGFSPLVGLLEAFDRGLDLDAAFEEVFATTPEEVDAAFESFCREKIRDLHIEPNWAPETLARLSLRMRKEPPEDPAARARWAADWTTLARGAWQSGRRIDAEQGLRRLKLAGIEDSRALFLRGELAFASGDDKYAIKLWKAGLAAGGRDFRVRMALGAYALEAGEQDEAEAHFRAAEADFPGFDDGPSAELQLARLYLTAGRDDDAQLARERWLAFDAGEYDLRVTVAGWHVDAGRPAAAAKWYAEANEVDPFRRSLHVAWAETLSALGRHAEAAREFQVAQLVPAVLDADEPPPLSNDERAELAGREARAWLSAGREAEALAAAQRALDLDPGEREAGKVLEELQ